ncbi:TspO [Tamlana nanhaiensis]|uniref:TspO n=1 Tax=Neotamlana nanhaiensis TaxID=1382798 RepID=A0A0D7W956_9FLAO|nr:TspO/MBR family protein [Tamlana nanhaiensis]KJD34307.1 TspO [Tamlana nanhaiensis]
MKLVKGIIIFLIINFGALAMGTLLMNNEPQTTWYASLNKAPWTPPGWLFGVAWSTIMLCFSIYMAYLYKLKTEASILVLFSIQFVLNVSWNFLFFNKHFILLGLICILLLTLVVAKFLFDYKATLKYKSLLILPYLVWLCIATSLNAYIFIYN